MTEHKEPKLVILMRTDLGMSKGKMIAQAGHAILGWMTGHGRCIIYRDDDTSEKPNELLTKMTRAQTEWVNNSFVKVALRVDSEEELLNLAHNADALGLPVMLIQDEGRTVFDGVPTYTCCSIGPDWGEKIDAVTGDLKLL